MMTIWCQPALQLPNTREANGPDRQAEGSAHLAPRSSPPVALPVPGAAGPAHGSLADVSFCP